MEESQELRDFVVNRMAELGLTDRIAALWLSKRLGVRVNRSTIHRWARGENLNHLVVWEVFAGELLQAPRGVKGGHRPPNGHSAWSPRSKPFQKVRQKRNAER